MLITVALGSARAHDTYQPSFSHQSNVDHPPWCGLSNAEDQECILDYVPDAYNGTEDSYSTPSIFLYSLPQEHIVLHPCFSSVKARFTTSLQIKFSSSNRHLALHQVSGNPFFFKALTLTYLVTILLSLLLTVFVLNTAGEGLC